MELRYNPLTDEWVMVSATRQSRPTVPEDVCPLCPGGPELPNEYDLVSFENRFPALKREAPHVLNESSVFKKRPSKGICEVVVYTMKHNASLPHMPLEQLHKLVKMWKDRTLSLSKYNFVRYVFIFENRGREVGATLDHPHGQIYAFPFIPKRIQAKIEALEKGFDEAGKCVLCTVIEEEMRVRERIVSENNSFISVVPFYARFPYEVHVYPKRHVDTIFKLNEKEEKDFAAILKDVTSRYDLLFRQAFPYMMMFFQSPFNWRDLSHAFHFHVEFAPPKRDAKRMKWMASVETGTWAFINPKLPEDAARELREVNLDG